MIQKHNLYKKLSITTALLFPISALNLSFSEAVFANESGSAFFTGSSSVTVTNGISSGNIIIIDTGDGMFATVNGNITAGEVEDATFVVDDALLVADGTNVATGTVVVTPVDNSNDIPDDTPIYDSNTGLVQFQSSGSGDNLSVTATLRTISEITTQYNLDESTATTLHELTGTIALQDTAVLNALNQVANSGNAVTVQALNQIRPQTEVLTAIPNAVIDTGNQVSGIAFNRLATLRTNSQANGNFPIGLASGDPTDSKNIGWVQTFGNWVEQDQTSSNSGFDADTYGTAFGLDTAITDSLRLGASFSYAVTDVEGQGSGQAKNDIDSYLGLIYGDYSTESFYIEASIGLGMNENESSRLVNFGGLDRIASADYDSEQYMASLNVGVPFEVGHESLLTPIAGLAYTHVTSDDYTETGAGGLNLNISPDDIDSLIASFAVEYQTRIRNRSAANIALIPSIKLGVSYDLADDEATATASYTGGGAAFNIEGTEVEQFAGTLGLGLAYENGPWSLSMNYNGEYKSDYASHSALLDFSVKF